MSQLPLLQGGIAAIIGRALNFILYDITLQRRVPGNLTQFTNYLFRGLVGTYSVMERAQTEIAIGDQKITLTQLSAPVGIVPAVGDYLIGNGKTYMAIRVDADPANATWTVQARG